MKISGGRSFLHAAVSGGALAVMVMATGCSGSAAEESGDSASELTALGLSPAEERWVGYVHANVVPRLAGSRGEQARTAAIVTWWALKEGVLDVSPSPFRHNLCTDLGVCSGPAWQVGLSGIQVGNVTAEAVEETAARLYPGVPVSTVLRDVAKAAGVDAATASTIERSTGGLRKSWLLRDPAIGITLQRTFVEGECLDASYSWCFGGWDTARAFASSSARIREVVSALEQRFGGNAAPGNGSPTPAPAQSGFVCPLGNGLYCGGNHVQGKRGVLYRCQDGSGLTVESACARGCDFRPDGENDRCLP